MQRKHSKIAWKGGRAVAKKKEKCYNYKSVRVKAGAFEHDTLIVLYRRNIYYANSYTGRFAGS